MRKKFNVKTKMQNYAYKIIPKYKYDREGM